MFHRNMSYTNYDSILCSGNLLTTVSVLHLKDFIKKLKTTIMQRILLFILAIIISGSLVSQNAPVAVDDYREVILGETITVNVTENDYHPDGLSFEIYHAFGSVSFTDSTITYEISYDSYYNYYPTDTIDFLYVLIDENGNFNDDSRGLVRIKLIGNKYFDFLDHNNIRAQIQAAGHQFWKGPDQNYTMPVYEFPKGSGINSIFNSNIWIGGMDESGDLRLAAERYNQVGLDYWPGPLSKNGSELSIDTSTVIEWQYVWKLTKEEIIYHKFHWWEAGYEPIENIATWPAHGDEAQYQAEYLAPFIDVDGDSIYNPMEGDYPLIRGDQCIYFIINDLRQHTESSGEALGLEIHGMAYEFYDDEILPMNNTLFFSYKIFNRSENTFDNTYIGLFTDFDLGYAWDDYVGCDVARGTYYGYNGDSIDGDGEPGTYGDYIPAQGITILGGPMMDADGIDNPDGGCDESINGVGFGDDIADNERYGMKKFIYFNNGGNAAQSDPSIAPEYYSYLQGIWKDGTVMEYGGNGHVSSGAYGPAASFMFPSLSDPCYWGTNGIEPYGPIDWTETSAGNLPGDRRGLSVMGPFTFEPGTMERVDIAYVSAFPDDDNTAVEQLMNYIDVVKAEYQEDPTYFGYQWLGIEDEKIETTASKLITYPNPVDNMLTFIYEGKYNTATYKLTDIMGKVIITGKVNKDESNIIDLSKLTSGLFILTVTDTKNMYTTKVIKR